MNIHFTMKRYVLLAARGARILAGDISEYRRVEGVTHVRLDVLMLLQRGPLLQRDLSIAFCVCPSVMSRIVSALEKHGYVARTKMPGDRRQRIVQITPRGCWVLDPLYDGILADAEGSSLQFAIEDQLRVDWGHVFDRHHVSQGPLPAMNNCDDSGLIFEIGPTLRRIAPAIYFDNDPDWQTTPAVPTDSETLERLLRARAGPATAA